MHAVLQIEHFESSNVDVDVDIDVDVDVVLSAVHFEMGNGKSVADHGQYFNEVSR